MAMSLSSTLFKIARTSSTIEAITSGNPKRITRRAKNIVVGRTLKKIGFWKVRYVMELLYGK